MSNIPIIGTKKPDAKEPHIRLLICLDCATIEEIPDYEGDPRDDVLLEISCERHEDVTGNRHRGHLMKVPLKYWAIDSARQKIVQQIKDGSKGLEDVDKGWYDTKSQFSEDAMECFNRHLRPAGRCPDWKAESKVLKPKTAAARKDLGLAPLEKSTAQKTYLCQFCPASIYMHTKLRELRGLYE